MQTQLPSDLSRKDVFLRRVTSLRMPDMHGKSYLDVGCEAGAFCGYAQFDGATHVTGIDPSKALLQKAESLYPDIDFRHQPIDRLPDDKFDVITLLMKLNHAQAPEALIRELISRLSDDGVLIIETGLAPDGENEWVSATESGIEGIFPTPQKLSAVLQDSAWKIIGYGATQANEAFRRRVVHVRKLKPYAWLLMENPGAGKSTIIRRLFNQTRTVVISGDELYRRLAHGEYQVSSALRAALKENFSCQRIDAVTHALFAQGLLEDIVSFWAEHVGYRDFALDSFVPAAYRQGIRTKLQGLGYFPVDLSWDSPVAMRAQSEIESSVEAYRKWLGADAPETDFRYISVAPVSDFKSLSFLCHLDSPTYEALGESVAEVRVSGWLIDLERIAFTGEIYIQTPTQSLSFPINQARPDVLSHVFEGDERVPPAWRETTCGFDFTIPVGTAAQGFEIGLVDLLDRTPLWQVRLSLNPQPPAPVLASAPT